MALWENKTTKYTQQIKKQITLTTLNPPPRIHALKYPYRSLWARSINVEIDKRDESGTIHWLVISLTLSFNYKRDNEGGIEEHKSCASIRRDQMIANIHFDPKCTSATMVDRMATRMVVAYCLETG